jgi:hypothetical protein
MNRSRLLAALTCFFLGAAQLSAVDLTLIDRKIAREPAYKSKPKYCLLVFGPQAQTRVWLVLDGDTLYVDRNGNGDLTEAGAKVTANKREGADADEYNFQAGDVRNGALLHKDLFVRVTSLSPYADQDEFAKALVTKDPKARAYHLSLYMEMPGRKGTGVGGRVHHRAFYVDVNGVLQFADRPRDAPVVHFGGPLQVTLFGRHRLTVGRVTDVVLGVGTCGLGPGTTAWIDYEGVIPEKVYPTLEITYPPKRPGEPPVTQRYELPRRC